MDHIFNPAFHKAAKMTIMQAFKQDADAVEVRLQLCLQASRAVAYNQIALGKLVKRDNAVIGDCLNVEDNRRVSLSNPANFHQVTELIQNDFLSKQGTPQHNLPPPGADTPSIANAWAPKGGRAAQVTSQTLVTPW